MAHFDVKCPNLYPMKCNLSPADREYLETPEKYKAFFILQYEDNDEYLQPVLENYFSNRTWRLFNAGKEAGLGTKFCNVCRYALASDFGIACLTPLNNNVFQEIGLMIGQQKPILYLKNPNRLQGKLPFDIDDQIYIPHTSRDELEQGLEKKMGLLIDKVELFSEFQKQFKESLQQKIDKLSTNELKIFKVLLIENRPFTNNTINKLRGDGKINAIENVLFSSFERSGLIVKKMYSETITHWEVNPEYRDILREIVFTK